MTENHIIRKYKTSDKAEVINLLRLNTPDYFSALEEKDLVYYLDNHAENYYVIERNGKLIGSGGFNFLDKGRVSISWDIFHPDYQGKGLGSKLIKYRIERIR